MKDAADVRRCVLNACLTLADQGFLPGTGGNIAMRVGESAFAVTPSAADYYTMVPEDICILDLASLRPIDSRRKPSVESGLHARMLRYRPDFVASIHTHQPIASAVTLINQSINVTDVSERAMLGKVVPMIPYGPSGTWFLARAFGKGLRQDSNAYFLRNHGIVCGGATMETAMESVRLLERVAARFLRERIQTHGASSIDGTIIADVLTETSASQ